MEKEQNESIIHDLNQPQTTMFSSKFIIVLVIVALLGVGTGYFLTRSGKTVSGSLTTTTSGDSQIEKGTIEGSDDLKTFKDTAEGVLKKGGIENEGQYHLVRPGGDSQNVYLTSSIVDLSKYVSRKVKVWGQTQTAQKAGWLMDVGRVEVLE